MRLHYHPLSPYARKALVAVYHRAQPVELSLVQVREGALNQPAFRAMSPFGKMPVLETEDGPLIESTSIIEYLEERGPRSLLPSGAERVARHFDRLGDNYLIDPMAALWWRPTSDVAKNAPETAALAWSLFDKQLDGRPFVAGEAFSLGDVGAAIATDYLALLGVQPPPSIREWCDRCFAVPAMARASAEAMPYVEKVLASRAAV